MAQQRERQRQQVLRQAIVGINERFPPLWSLVQDERVPDVGSSSSGGLYPLRLVGPRGSVISCSAAVLLSCEPRQAQIIAAEFAEARLAAGGPQLPLLIIVPWLSFRAQRLLSEANINYLDLSGNVRFSFSEPVFYCQAQGSDRNLEPADQTIAQVRGPKASRLLRLLTEVEPPYSVTELARATSLTAGYVSRLLEALDREALIDRGPRGRVLSVEVESLFRRWAENYQATQSANVTRYVAPNGLDELLGGLANDRPSMNIAVTGSFAAVRYAPVAAPSLLMIYCEDAQGLAKHLRLLPSDRGANVLLLEPADDAVFAGIEQSAGVPVVALAQAVVDCLTGNGRMPAEGEALLEWMLDHPGKWRSASIAEHRSRALRA